MSRQFNNEVGNSININVEEKDIASVSGVFITIAGPDSDMEIHITRQEAEVLTEQLGTLLSGKKS